jgi:archaellum component FlaC
MVDANKAAMEKLKKKGYKIEQQLNALIQSQLNKEDIARFAGRGGDQFARNLHQVKQNVETLSLYFNFPTKNDVANLARLMIQIEEKIEKLEEQLSNVTKTLETFKGKVENRSNLYNIEDGRTPRLQTRKGRIVLSDTPGKESKVVQMERWYNH